MQQNALWIDQHPTTFQQQLMETYLRDLNLNWHVIYLDDIVIFSKELTSNLERLEAMFWKLEQAGLKLNPPNLSYSADKLHT